MRIERNKDFQGQYVLVDEKGVIWDYALSVEHALQVFTFHYAQNFELKGVEK